MKKVVLGLFLVAVIFGFNQTSFAEKLVIIYTGETHASLYPCNCPIEPFGGVARRATKVKALRQETPDLLLVDSGGFFAGGVQDEGNKQTPELQKVRTKVYLESLKIMKYDALAIGNEEFNFGKDFLGAKIKEAKIPFLSCNAKIPQAKEFIIKEIKGLKIGIVGVTPLPESEAEKKGISGPEAKVKEIVNKLKAKKVDLIVVLSHLGEEQDKKIIQEVKGIDFVISGHILTGQDKFTKINDTVLVRPVWQARKLGKLEIDFKDKKISGFNVDWLPLGKEVADDEEVKALLPECFSNYDCQKPNFVGTCNNPGAKSASCAYEEVKRLSLLVIRPRNCRVCFTEPALSNINRLLPVNAKFADYEEESSKKLIERLGITMLPAYILTDSEVEKDRNFSKVTKFLVKKDNYYFFQPYFNGVSYFIGRPLKKNRLDLFILLSDQQSRAVLEMLKVFQKEMGKRFSLNIHFLVIENKDKVLVSPAGLPEVEEAKRSVCVAKYSPDKIWDYLICRSQDIQASSFSKCAQDLKIDAKKISHCSGAAEADNLLRENIKLTQELQLLDTPVILLENQEIFGITPKTTVNELKALIEGKIKTEGRQKK